MEDQMMQEEPQEGGTQEQMIFENLKLHKEVLSSAKLERWSLRRKINVVKQAKSYIRSHEGALQERLAQSRNTRDAVARASIVVNKVNDFFIQLLLFVSMKKNQYVYKILMLKFTQNNLIRTKMNTLKLTSWAD